MAGTEIFKRLLLSANSMGSSADSVQGRAGQARGQGQGGKGKGARARGHGQGGKGKGARARARARARADRGPGSRRSMNDFSHLATNTASRKRSCLKMSRVLGSSFLSWKIPEYQGLGCHDALLRKRLCIASRAAVEGVGSVDNKSHSKPEQADTTKVQVLSHLQACCRIAPLHAQLASRHTQHLTTMPHHSH